MPAAYLKLRPLPGSCGRKSRLMKRSPSPVHTLKRNHLMLPDVHIGVRLSRQEVQSRARSDMQVPSRADLPAAAGLLPLAHKGPAQMQVEDYI
jgi:hypothetical protein